MRPTIAPAGPPIAPDLGARRAARNDRVPPGRAVVGAALAVLGVLLTIGAVLLLGSGGRDGSPEVDLPPGTALGTAPSTTAPTPGGAPQATATSRPSPAASPGSLVLAPQVRPPARATTPALPPGARSGAEAPVLPVTVLNNSRFSGLAQREAARYRAGGWPVPVTGNFTGRLRATTVYFAPGQQGSAQRFARQFAIPRVLPRFASLPGRGLTVVVTRDVA